MLYMFLMTLAFTFLVSWIKLSTEERIRTNEKVKLQRIILRVMNIPATRKVRDEEVMRIFDSRVKTVELNGTILYVGYTEDGKSVMGYAFPVGGPGFWGPISGMVGVDSKGSKILGIDFYRHSETPGLGARMTEEWFRKQFVGLSIVPREGDVRIFSFKPAGTKKAPNELDAITGATGTSRGIDAFLNRDLERFRKEIWGALQKRVEKDAEAS